MAVAALCAERAGPGRARGAQPPDRGRGGAGAAAGAEHPRSPAVRELQSPRRPLDRHAGAWGPGRAPRSAPRQPPFCRRPERVVPRVLAPRRAGTRSGAADVTGLRPAPSVVRVGQKEALDAGSAEDEGYFSTDPCDLWTKSVTCCCSPRAHRQAVRSGGFSTWRQNQNVLLVVKSPVVQQQ
ncbi:uncharacterized protein LOC121075289 isoform X14 [Cygnus olor]|uniref:uncharacterized protein LOC121075289 isoform X14 n=1 Tax=Cygnus olor TaxID=8869 RepID=UPI001ADE253C|nr:uncharacterized protein LOC121075289 isoform X14 [Cygnus olor]XP_040424308.1 uncharacterized protein LOC121075289 isoform X14 [Cygnus olor]XP_040424309.1 uncharacterized protein LOC121075289 isoform X14 [Cygnus olor]